MHSKKVPSQLMLPHFPSHIGEQSGAIGPVVVLPPMDISVVLSLPSLFPNVLPPIPDSLDVSPFSPPDVPALAAPPDVSAVAAPLVDPSSPLVPSSSAHTHALNLPSGVHTCIPSHPPTPSQTTASPTWHTSPSL